MHLLQQAMADGQETELRAQHHSSCLPSLAPESLPVAGVRGAGRARSHCMSRRRGRGPSKQAATSVAARRQRLVVSLMLLSCCSQAQAKQVQWHSGSGALFRLGHFPVSLLSACPYAGLSAPGNLRGGVWLGPGVDGPGANERDAVFSPPQR